MGGPNKIKSSALFKIFIKNLNIKRDGRLPGTSKRRNIILTNNNNNNKCDRCRRLKTYGGGRQIN